MIDNLTKSEWNVLKYFLDRPDSRVHVRDLTEKIDVPYSTVRDCLSSLESKGVLQSEEKGNLKIFRTGEKFRTVKRTWNLHSLESSGLPEFIDEELRPECIVLFGSFLSGRDTIDSDIDIAVVGGRSKSLDLERFEESLNRDIQLQSIDDLGSVSGEFRATLINGYVLRGYLDLS